MMHRPETAALGTQEMSIQSRHGARPGTTSLGPKSLHGEDSAVWQHGGHREAEGGRSGHRERQPQARGRAEGEGGPQRSSGLDRPKARCHE